MKQKLILLCLFLMCSFAMMGQNPNTTGTITRQRKPTQQQTTTTQGSGTAKKKKTPRQQTVSATPTAYDVTFSCNVPTATLYIDGNNYGTPSGTRTLKTGNHSIRLTAEGYEDYQTTITVSANSQSFILTMKKKPEPVQTNKTFTANGVSFTMVYVQGGTFTMGATSEQGSDAYDDEKPTHSVTLSSYYMGETEVTQGLWQAVMGSLPSDISSSSADVKGSQRPVCYVSWEDCQTFISRLNYLTGQQFHLPTEAQWEYAARGGSKSRGYKYSGSNDLGSVAWYTDNTNDKGSHNVKTKSPNELGLYDMSGNVYEWCSDWDGSYSSGSQTNPTGASSGSYRVYRGGGWFIFARYCRVSFRGDCPPSDRGDNLGLRLAL